MTLGGMMNHLAFVEEYWCSFRLWNQPMGDVFGLVDRNLDPDADWHAATTQSPDALRGRWTASIAQSERNVERALATGGLDQPTRRSSEPDEVPSLRWVLVHLIEEYARHNGHADILRELIDGSVGE